MFPASDQLTRQTASGKWGSLDGADGRRGVEVHGEVGEGREWIMTVRSYPSGLYIDVENETYLRSRSNVHPW